MAWFRADLHIHTPASADYQDMDATYLHILQQAEERGIEIVAFTDHNTVSGIATMRREIEDLELLEQLGRLNADEATLLAEYRRVMTRVLVLPGFEFSAAYGFHILALFSPETSIRKLEHLLMLLNVPEDQMEMGSSQVGATADVLTAYEAIAEHGGLVIPAHVDATHGVAAPGFRFGGQTKIAYTQSEYIAALEVTDLGDMTRRATAGFFNGSKPEYPRRMHCIQGSDAHRVSREGARRETDLGVGDRATEVALPERTFAALKDLFAADDFARTRPYQPASATPHDPVQAAREQGPTIAQSFHEQVRSRRSRYRPILKDVVGFANTNGGTIYVGVSANAQQPAVGVPTPEESARGLREALARSVVPALDVTVDDEMMSGGKPVLIITVPKGLNTPYATDAGQVFVRQGSQTVVALRDEIVQLVRETMSGDPATAPPSATGERVWSLPRVATESDDEGDDADEPTTPPPAPATAPRAAAPDDGPATHAPQPSRSPRRGRRGGARTEAEERQESPIYSLEPQPQPGATPSSIEESARLTAALDLAAGLPETIAPPEPVSAPATIADAPPAEPEPEPAPTSPAATSALVVEAQPPAIEPQTDETPTAESAEPSQTEAATAPPKPRRRTRKPKAEQPEPPEQSAATPTEAVATVPAPPPAPLPAPPVIETTPQPVKAPPRAARRKGGETAVAPKSGIEILGVAERDGERYYTMRDLRGGRVLDDVTRRTARRLWRIAILEREGGLPDAGAIRWQGDRGYVGSETRDGVRRHTLAIRADDGAVRYFYAVADDGLDTAWRGLIGDEDAG